MTIKFGDPQVNYFVEDVETAVRFYAEHFEFVETFRTPKQGKPEHVEMKLGSLTLRSWAAAWACRLPTRCTGRLDRERR